VIGEETEEQGNGSLSHYVACGREFDHHRGGLEVA
jgi:hypothetical protein